MASLIILAGGFGNRFGGVKQFRPVGPNGECLLHYTMFDAHRAGFQHFVILTRKALDEQIEENVIPILNGKLSFDIAYQESPGGKAKGTAHALLACQELVMGSFGQVNADDYYGQESYQTLFDLLNKHPGPREAVLVPYPISKTLSQEGAVSRAVVEESGGELRNIEEHHNIKRVNGVIKGDNSSGQVTLSDDAQVSLNMFGFSPDAFVDLEEFCARSEKENPGKEMLLPTFLNENVQSGKWKAFCEATDSKWFGMTYLSEEAMVKETLTNLMMTPSYPDRLW